LAPATFGDRIARNSLISPRISSSRPRAPYPLLPRALLQQDEYAESAGVHLRGGGEVEFDGVLLHPLRVLECLEDAATELAARLGVQLLWSDHGLHIGL
jgi:hypothetical protein